MDTSGFSNLSQLASYQRDWFRGDLLAGVTVAAFLVPQVMAYAAVAGLPAIAGLWAILPCLVLYALLGSSRQLSVGPESTTALLTASIIGPLAAGDPSRYARLAAELALIFGVFCIIAWLLRLGFIAELLSRPVLVGYLAGVAVIMIVGQLGAVAHVPIDGESPWSKLASLIGRAGEIKPASVGIAAVTIALVMLFQRFWPQIPGALVAVTAMTLLVVVAGLDRHGVTVVGTLDGGFPRPRLPAFSDLGRLLVPALGIFVVGYTDNVIYCTGLRYPRWLRD